MKFLVGMAITSFFLGGISLIIGLFLNFYIKVTDHLFLGILFIA